MKIRGSPEQEYEKWQVLDKLISFQVVVGKCNPGVAWMNMPQVINESGRDTEPTSSLQIKAESTGQSEGRSGKWIPEGKSEKESVSEPR